MTNNQIILYGRHTIISLLNNKNRIIHNIYTTQSNYDLVKNHPKVEVVEQKALEMQLQKNGIGKVLHQGIFAIVEKLRQPSFEKFLTPQVRFLLLIDEIQDSHNLGAIIRSANLFEVDAVITTQNNSPDENPQMLKVASGAFEEVSFIQVINLTNTIEKLQKIGFWIIGLSCHSRESLKEVVRKIHPQDKIAIVLGSEEKGLRPRVEKSCDFLAKITTAKRNSLDSLNVSNAAAITLYEIHQLLFGQ
jgi:23S rRNA (guanosine2251-2'-O)-methyltransferase